MDDWQKAGSLSAQALEYGKKLIKDSERIVIVCDKIEEKIRALGAKPAFPVQVSINDTAAHCCPDYDDTSVFKGLVKLDLGVSVNGAIGDNAVSVDLSGKYDHLIKAAIDARDKAVALVKKKAKETTLSEIGKLIEETISGYKLTPVRNLSGHGLRHEEIHTPPTIPNTDTGENEKLTEGVFAIEPFSTTGIGLVKESEQEANIFSLQAQRPLRTRIAREAMRFIEQEYSTLPFTTRWLVKKFGLGQARLALRELRQVGAVHSYPPLVEQSQGIVAQSEHTLRITDKVEVLTISE